MENNKFALWYTRNREIYLKRLNWKTLYLFHMNVVSIMSHLISVWFRRHQTPTVRSFVLLVKWCVYRSVVYIGRSCHSANELHSIGGISSVCVSWLHSAIAVRRLPLELFCSLAVFWGPPSGPYPGCIRLSEMKGDNGLKYLSNIIPSQNKICKFRTELNASVCF